MRTKSAVMRVATFCGPDDLLYFVWGDPFSWVVAECDGFTLAIQLDVQVPTFAVAAKSTSKAFRGLTHPIRCTIKPDMVEFEDPQERQVQFGVQTGPISVPRISIPDSMEVVEDWPWILCVARAAAVSKDQARGVLRCVRFGDGEVLASDETSLAHAKVNLGQGQLFRGSCFLKWPKGEVKAHITDTYGHFQTGDEIRVCTVVQGMFPPIRNLLKPSTYFSYRQKFDVLSLRKAIEEVVSGSKLKQVSCQFTTEGVQLGSEERDDEISIPALEGRGSHILSWVDSRRVVSLLKTLPVSEVWVLYESPDKPLRFRAHEYTEDVYPLMEV